MLRIGVRLFAFLYLSFLIVYQVHSPTTALFTDTTTINGIITAGKVEEAETNEEWEEEPDDAAGEESSVEMEVKNEAEQADTVNEQGENEGVSTGAAEPEKLEDEQQEPEDEELEEEWEEIDHQAGNQMEETDELMEQGSEQNK